MIKNIQNKILKGSAATAFVLSTCIALQQNANAMMYVEAAYTPVLQSSFEYTITPKTSGGSSAGNAVKYTSDTDDFDWNFAGGHIGFGTVIMNGLRIGVMADFYGETNLTDSVTINTTGNNTGNASVDLTGKYSGNLAASVLAASSPTTQTLNASSLKPIAKTLSASDIVSTAESVEVTGNQNMFLGVSVGYEMMMSGFTPFIDVGIGANQLTMKFESASDLSDWVMAFQGKIGLGYDLGNNITPYIAYAFRTLFETTFDDPIEPIKYDVYNMPAAMIKSDGTVDTSMDLTNSSTDVAITTTTARFSGSNVAATTPGTDPYIIAITDTTLKAEATGTAPMTGLTYDGTGKLQVDGAGVNANNVDVLLVKDYSNVELYQKAQTKKVTSSTTTNNKNEYKYKITKDYINIFEIGVKMSF